MNRFTKNKRYYLSYSKFLSYSPLNSFIYIIQLLLAKLSVTNIFFASKESNHYKSKLLLYLDAPNHEVFCQSPSFGITLQDFHSATVVLDLKEKKNLGTTPLVLYDFMWSVIHSHSMTKLTFKNYRQFLPVGLSLYD